MEVVGKACYLKKFLDINFQRAADRTAGVTNWYCSSGGAIEKNVRLATDARF